jgi:hypothetical protein
MVAKVFHNITQQGIVFHRGQAVESPVVFISEVISYAEDESQFVVLVRIGAVVVDQALANLTLVDEGPLDWPWRASSCAMDLW